MDNEDDLQAYAREHVPKETIIKTSKKSKGKRVIEIYSDDEDLNPSADEEEEQQESETEGEVQEEEKRIGEKSKKALKKRENEKSKPSTSADEASIGETPISGDIIVTQPKVLIA